MLRNQTSTAALRLLPSVDRLLRTDQAHSLRNRFALPRLTLLARTTLAELRANLQQQLEVNLLTSRSDEDLRERLLALAAERLLQTAEQSERPSLRRVINATGVILHTNLGRAPLSEAARRHVFDEAARYCTLEYDLDTGERGPRGGRVEELLTELTRAEAALVVNNCAAATVLILAALAERFETIISRGELVEIGGDFRVPTIMAQSGTRMVEVGTTNRTRLDDYQSAITEQTRLILRVHPSNYRIIGFTHTPTISELAALAHDSGLLLYEDAGSGALTDLHSYGLEDEPVISSSIATGVDVVSFSADKLLGASQAGCIVGRKSIIDSLRKHPLYRALRIDKLRYAALEATLDAHLRGRAFADVPTLRMIALTPAEIEQRAVKLLYQLASAANSYKLQCTLTDGRSAIGGGAAPTIHPPTRLIALKHQTLSASEIERTLRHNACPPVIARIEDDHVVIDLRTVFEDEEVDLLHALSAV